MIGISLPFDWISLPGIELDSLLSLVKRGGAQSIELRTVRAHHRPEAVRETMQRLFSFGFCVTVHGAPTSVETAVEDVLGPLSLAMDGFPQKSLTVTVHPIDGDNVEMLRRLSDAIRSRRYPIVIALENNRLLPDKTEGDSTALVLQAVEEVDRDNVGICFDMGHFAYYVKKNRPDESDYLPPKGFWKRVVHTHIHAMNGLRTHFPLGEYELPFDRYVEKLAPNYFGLYQLELDFPRLAKAGIESTDAIERSLSYLSEHLPPSARLFDRIRDEFDTAFTKALSLSAPSEQGTAFSLIHSTSYLFRTGSFFWAMDLAFRHAATLAETPNQLDTLLSSLDLMILTHAHRDHFEENTLRQLAKGKTRFVVPDFMCDRLFSLGIDSSRILTVRAGQVLSVGPLSLSVFQGSHFRADTGVGVEEYGYQITLPDGVVLAFPADVRDYSKKKPEGLAKADYCFAHIWLSDDNRDRAVTETLAESLAHYMLAFSDRTLFLTHLYENARPAHKMWRMEHAHLVREAILNAAPEAEVLIPDWGEIHILKKRD